MNATVGRETELRRLAEVLSTLADGHGATCFISGEVGSGKSTLVQEFTARALASHTDVVVATGGCNAQVGVGDPYLPFLDVVSDLTGHVDAKTAQGRLSETAASRLRRVGSLSANLLLDFAPDLLGTLIPGSSLIARMVKSAAEKSGVTDRLQNFGTGGSTDDKRIDQKQIFDSYGRFLRGLARQTRVVIILDDLHWADASSCSLLFHLAHSLRDAPILFIGTYRPNDLEMGIAGERHPMVRVINELKRYFGEIVVDLDRHGEDRRRAFVRELVDVEPNDISDTWCDALLRHTRGHPLFAVELIRALRERGELVRNERGVWSAKPSTDWSVLPARVEGVIEERVGRLEDELRDVLKVASVEGEIFTAEIVARIEKLAERKLLARLSDELAARHRLVAEGEVKRSGRTFLSQYSFNHALIQKYFYDHIGLRERMILHQQVGELLEELYAGRTDEVAAQLARHFVEAGDARKAFEYAMKVATRAMRVSAYDEVLAQTAVALQMLPDIEPAEQPSLELDALLERGRAFQATLGWSVPETIQTFARARELAATLPPSPRMLPLLFGQFAELLTRGRYPEAREVAGEIQRGHFENTDNGPLTVAAAIGASSFWLGRIVESREASVDGLRHPPVVGQLDGSFFRVSVLRQMMLDEFFLGNEEAADRHRAEMLAFAEQTANPFANCFARAAVAWDAYNRGDALATRRAADQALTEEVKHFPFYQAQALLFRAWAGAMTGEADALRRLDEVYDTLVRKGTYFYSVYVAMRAQILIANETWPEAMEWLDAGIERVLELQDVAYLAELHRYRGEVLLSLGRPDDAVHALRTAASVAGEQQAKVFEARAREALERVETQAAARQPV